MVNLTMFVGVSGSGKSTIAANLSRGTDTEIVSSDAIRGEIYGDENCQDNPAKVFEIVHNRIHAALREGRDVIYDATNLSCKRRMAFLKTIAHLNVYKRCVVVVATPEDIEERMKSRKRKVPMEVVHRQLCQFQCPNYYEGWDKIIIRWTSDNMSCLESFKKLYNTECYIPHDNSHHTFGVRRHMEEAEVIACMNPNSTIGDVRAAAIHDCGKPRTKVFTDKKGNRTEEAHYYGHQNYSAYYALIALCSIPDHIEVLNIACLIQWHMEHYLRNESSLTKFYEMIGSELTARLHILEEADQAAH